jgi:hypothetical protein
MSAQFRVEAKRGDTWKFDGKILIHETSELDRLTIEQYENNSLYIRRYLTGALTGQRQWASMHPPSFSQGRNGGRTAHFGSRAHGGFGCSGPATILLRAQ